MNCANHPERIANNLCMSCGKWYCNSCMDISHSPPVCNNCKSAGTPENHSHAAGTGHTSFFNKLFNSSDKVKTLIKGGMCVFFVGILIFTILFQIKGLKLFTEINYNFLRYIPVFAALIAVIAGFVLLRSKSSKQTALKEITSAQIEALLKANNTLTVSRLANATNTSEEYAKKVLDTMVVDGKLTISANYSYELVYSGIFLP